MIQSPTNSFVDFNGDNVDCKGREQDVALPVYDNFGIKFQFNVTDELLPTNTMFYAGVCADGELVHDPNYAVVPICIRKKFMTNIGPLLDSHFPLLVGNYDPGNQIPEGTYDKQSFLQAINSFYETDIPDLDFITCCGDNYPVIEDIVVFLNGTGIARSLSLNTYYASAYVDFPANSMTGIIAPEECFRYCILNNTKTVIASSNLFKRITDPCLTTVFTYYNEENGFDFKYVSYVDGSTVKFTENQIRLFTYFNKPKPDITENVLRVSSNKHKRLSTVVNKVWHGNVSYMSGEQHYKYAIMLKHDYLYVQHPNKNIDGFMTQEGTYEIEYPDMNLYPVAPASYDIIEDSKTTVNNNCGFNCGVEIITDCSGGGVTPPAGEKYHIEFSTPSAQMPIGGTSFQDNALKGKQNIQFTREGLEQYSMGDNYYSFNSATGTVTFFPAAYNGERFSIWEI